jgi:5'-nucleotidase/UDP-sugar diphosphatase
MNTFIKRALLSASALGLSSGVALADFTLDILHINDLHSRIESINRFDSTCSAEDEGEGKCFGGVARVKTKIDERRRARRGGRQRAGARRGRPVPGLAVLHHLQG